MPEHLADLGKEVADLPLTPADVGAAANVEQVEPEAFKTFAIQTNMEPAVRLDVRNSERVAQYLGGGRPESDHSL